MIRKWGNELRYATRRLRHSPAFTLLCVLTLALGIGGCTTIFSAVYQILFASLPYPNAGKIVAIWDLDNDGSHLDITFGTYRELVKRSHEFNSMAIMRPWQPTLLGSSQPERLDGQLVSASYFHVLGISPALGQDFNASDDQPNGPKNVILGYGLWQRRFAGERDIIGRQITLGDQSYTVAGIMPRTFENVLSPSAEVWSLNQGDLEDWGHNLRMIGRLQPNVNVEQSRAELNEIAHNPTSDFPRKYWASLKRGLVVQQLQQDTTETVRPVLLVIFAAVGIVLLIACVNVTNLLIARASQKKGEFAVRAALGASRTNLISQLMAESLLLAFSGGIMGIILAKAGLQALIALSPPGLPRASDIRINVAVFLFAVGISTIVGIIVGLTPALQISRSNLQLAMQYNSRRTAGGHQLTRRTLVVTEVALALMLLAGAGLLLCSLQRLFSVDPGFNPSHLFTMQVQTSGQRFRNADISHRFFAQSLDAVRRVPGVAEAAFTSQLPLSGDIDQYGVSFEQGHGASGAFRYTVTPGYFEAMGIPLRKGRLLDAHDIGSNPWSAVINESFAKRKFPNQDPIGQRLHIGAADGPWYTVVGVVADVKQKSLAVAQEDEVYIPAEQWQNADRAMWLVVRAHGDPAPLIASIRDAVWSVDKDQPIVRIATMQHLLETSAADRRFSLVLFEAFGLIALILAGTGIYGVLSGSVTERVREIGVRSALGASPANILMLVIRQGITLTGLGVAVGLVATVIASQAIVAMLFSVSRLDPLTYCEVILLLAVISGLACFVPAWRAVRIDPLTALRAE
jgi:putative ABC transport system permease protein